MPVDAIHADHAEMAPRWHRCRIAFAGQDAVHGAREDVLPRLREQSDADYKAYLTRAPWYAASGRTRDGLVGMVFRKAPALVSSASFAALAEDIGMDGRAYGEFSRDVFAEVVSVGRAGVLVEYPEVTAAPQSLADAGAMGLRPYATIYRAEAIRNWRTARIANMVVPVLVVLDETWEDRVDEFSAKVRPQIRVLSLDGGGYRQRLYRKDAKDRWTLHHDMTPTKNGAPLDRIPFFAFGCDSNDFAQQMPPLLDLVDLNLSHFRSGADLEHGAHFTGLPMLFLSGVQMEKGEKISLGSQSAVVAPDPSANGRYIEFSGQGLEALEKRCERKEAQMASIGARMLAAEKAGIEAADTIAQRHTGEHSVLAAMAALCADGLERVFRAMADWAGLPDADGIELELNRDYAPAGLSAQDLTALVSAWQSGAISWDVLFANLQRGDVVAGDVDIEDERGRRTAAEPMADL